MTSGLEAVPQSIKTLIVWFCLLSANGLARPQELPNSPDRQSPAGKESLAQTQQRAELQSQSQSHWLNGELGPAIERLQQLIDLESSLFGRDSERLAERYESLSNLLLESGDLQQAETSLKRACQSLRANYPPTSWQAIEADRKLALFKQWTALPAPDRQTLFDLNREVNQHYESLQFGDALLAAEKLARTIGDQFGERDPIWIDAIATIETVHMAQGNLENVGPQLEMLYSRLEQVEHPDHPNFGKLLWLLASHARFVGDASAAQRYGSAAIQQYERAKATYDLNYARALGQYATTLYGQGDLEQSVPMLRKAFTIWTQGLAISDEQETVLGYDLCRGLEELGEREFHAQRWDQAEALFGESHQVAMQTWGEGHYRVNDLEFRVNLVRLARTWTDTELSAFERIVSLEEDIDDQVKQADFPVAIELAQERLAATQALLGADARLTLTAEQELLTLQMQHGQLSSRGWKRFTEMLPGFVARHQQAFGLNHPDHAELCFYVAEFLPTADPIALDLARQSMEAYQNVFTRTSEEYVVARTLVGTLLATQDDESCVEILEDSIQLWEAGQSAGCVRHCKAALALGRYYYGAGDSYEARIQLSKAVALIRENKQLPFYELANALNNLANIYSDYEDYQGALVYYREALALYRQAGGESDIDNGKPSDWLLYNAARSCYYTRQYAEAEVLLDELVRRFPETALSDEDAFRSGCYYLTKVLQKLGKADLARQTLGRASAAVELHFRDDPQVFAEMLLENAELHSLQSQTDEARKYLDQAFEILSSQIDLATLSDGDASSFFRLLDRLIANSEEIGAWDKSAEVRSFTVPLVDDFYSEYWGWIVVLERQQLAEVKRIARATPVQQAQIRRLQERTKYLAESANSDYRSLEAADDASLVACYESCVEVLGEYSLIAANYRQEIAAYWEHQQQYLAAMTSQKYAVESYLKLLGDTHPQTARGLVKCARMGRQIGAYEECKQMLELGIRVLVDIQGDMNDDTIEAKLELAKLLLDVRDYAAALPLARTVENDFGQLWGRSNVIYASALGVLGEVYYGMNELELAADYLSRSQQLLDTLLEPFDRRLLRSAARAAIAGTWIVGRTSDSTEAIERVLAAYEASQQSGIVDCVELLVDYGDVLVEQGKYAEAESVLLRAANSIVELDGMGDDIMRAAIGSRLGSTQRKLGKLQAAAERLSSAAEFQRRIFGDQSQALCETLFQQSIAAHLAGDFPRANLLVLESLSIEQKLLGDIGHLLSDKSLSSMLTADENRLSLLLSGLLKSERNSEAVAQAFYWTLQRKGLALDLSCRLRRLQQSRMYDSKVVRLAGRVRLLNQELADLALLPTEKKSLQEIRRQQADINRSIATANSELSLALQGAGVDLLQTSDDATAVQKLLPPGTLLIEYVRVDSFVDSTAEEQPPRYIAFLVSSDVEQPIQVADLGEVQELDTLIDEMRAETRRFARALKPARWRRPVAKPGGRPAYLTHS
jgi:TolA-binding protein